MLRNMSNDDLDRVWRWRNHPDVRTCMFTTHEIPFDEHTNWFESVHHDPARHLLIYERAGEAVGFVQISKLGLGRIGYWGFYANPYSPRGVGFELGLAAVAYAFETLGLHKLCGQALVFNERSIQLHQRLGFQREGLMRDQHFDGACYHDVVHFGLLANQWSSKQ